MTAADPVPVAGRDAPVVVVGAGPCGIAAGVALNAAGIPAVLFEKGSVVQAIVDYPTRLTMFSTPEKLVIGDVPFASAGFRPTRAETLEYYRGVVATHALDVRERERVTAISRSSDGFAVHTASSGEGRARRDLEAGAAVWRAGAVVIATGYFDHPNLLGVTGEDLPHVSHRFVDGDAARDRRVVVVGGGNSAVEAAMELVRFGARVTLVHYESGFVSHVIKPWILPEYEAMVAAGHVVPRWNSRVVGITADAVTVRSPSGSERVPADFVYLMTGYTPQPGLLGELGVPFDAETGIPAHDPTTMETAVPGVFIAGVLASGKKANGVFIENGRGHGTQIARALVARR